MLNTNQKTRQTRSTLSIDGIAPINALTTTLIPSKRDNALKGRKARKVLIALNAGTSATPINEATNPLKET